MNSTREYHQAMQEWAKTLRFTDEEIISATRMVGSAAIHDLDFRLYGKPGVFFNMGTCFYELRRNNANRFEIVGFGKVLVENPGAVLSLFDDVQGITFGDVCLTKNIVVGFTQPPQRLYGQTLKLNAIATAVTEGQKTTITTKTDLRDKSGTVHAWSQATFVQTPELKLLVDRKPSLEEQNSQRRKMWEGLRAVRVTGKSEDDPKMSFRIRTDHNVKEISCPSQWNADGFVPSSQTPLLRGRVQMDHLGGKSDACRAVVRPLITAEGPPGRMHGGCAAMAWLDVLSQVVDMINIKEISLTYRRPIDLHTTVFVDWKKVDAEWQCRVTDAKGELLQTMQAKFFVHSDSEDRVDSMKPKL